jgi:hypothetical protein
MSVLTFINAAVRGRRPNRARYQEGHALVETAAAGSQRPELEASSHWGVVVVRAPDEETARDKREGAFGLKTRLAPGAGIKAAPWKRASLVSAERVRDQRYEEEGPDRDSRTPLRCDK